MLQRNVNPPPLIAASRKYPFKRESRPNGFAMLSGGAHRPIGREAKSGWL